MHGRVQVDGKRLRTMLACTQKHFSSRNSYGTKSVRYFVATRRIMAGLRKSLNGLVLILSLLAQISPIKVEVVSPPLSPRPSVGSLPSTVVLPRVHFITYGHNEPYESTKLRLTREANETGWFASVKARGPDDLPAAFRNQFREVLQERRGAGYWIWKYAILKMALQTMAEGELLVYMDAGCRVNAMGAARFVEYVKMLLTSTHDVISFKLAHKERVWTTDRVFRAFGINETNHEIRNSEQLMATVLILRKGPHAREWLEMVRLVMDRDPWVFTDRYNDEAKRFDPAFKDNRHDQSVLSVSRKIVGSIEIDDESYPPGQTRYPFWATRIRPHGRGLAQHTSRVVADGLRVNSTLKEVALHNQKWRNKVAHSDVGWIQLSTIRQSIFDYGLSTKPLVVQKKLVAGEGPAPLLHDLITWFGIQIGAQQLEYLEVGVSVLKCMTTQAHAWRGANLTAFDIEEPNVDQARKWGTPEVLSSWPLTGPIRTLAEYTKPSGTVATLFSFLSNDTIKSWSPSPLTGGNAIHYVASDANSPTGWENLAAIKRRNGRAPFNLVLSDGLHSPGALAKEVEYLKQNSMLASPSGGPLTIIWDDCQGSMHATVHHVLIRELAEATKRTDLCFVTLFMPGWMGIQEALHPTCILTSLSRDLLEPIIREYSVDHSPTCSPVNMGHGAVSR